MYCLQKKKRGGRDMYLCITLLLKILEIATVVALVIYNITLFEVNKHFK